MIEPPPFATNRRVGCVMWISIAALILSAIGLLLDITQEMAWDSKMEEISAIVAAGATGGQNAGAIPTSTPVQATTTDPIAAVTIVSVATVALAPSPIPTNTPLPVPTNTPLPPTPAVITPKDARASVFVHGNNSPQLPAGDLGKVSVVAFGKMQGTILPIVVRNNTSTSVTQIQVSGIARGGDNAMLATGGDQGISPNLVQPGEIAFGYVYFGDATLPEGTRFEFQSEFEPAGSSFEEFETRRDLEVAEASLVEDRIVGLLKNPSTEVVTGPMGVDAMCFDEAGQILGHYQDYTDQDTAAPGATVPYQVDLNGDPCPVFLVTGGGYSE